METNREAAFIASRRSFLKSAGAGGLTAALSLGSVRKALAARMRPRIPAQLLANAFSADLPESACHLPPVRVAADREIRTVAGLRPFRPSGFRVELEKFGTTTVVHNYGHGGGGITLSWGTSRLALDLGLQGHTGPVAVLGSGAVGLATARLLQEAGIPVTVYTKALPPDTTSNIAGGQWFPASVYDPQRTLTPEFTGQFQAAARYSYRRYQIMTGSKYGIRWMRNYFLSKEPFRFPTTGGQFSLLQGLLPELRDLTPQEHPFVNMPYVRQFDGLLIEPPVYLPAVLDEVRLAGGKVVVGEVQNTDQMRKLPEKLVFNCTGLGAKALFGDAELTPVRGQLAFLLPQPEVTYATTYEDTYMFSRRDGILLGGSHEAGDWSLDSDMETKIAVLAKQKELFDGMRSC